MASTASSTEEKILAQIFIEIFKLGLNNLADWINWGKQKTRTLDPLNLSATRYADRLGSRLNYIRIYGMGDTVPLLKLFVDAKVAVYRSPQDGIESEVIVPGMQRIEMALDLVRKNHYRIVIKNDKDIYDTLANSEEQEKGEVARHLADARGKYFASEAEFESSFAIYLRGKLPAPIVSKIKDDSVARNRLIILGSPGGGKTTLLKRLALDAIAHSPENPRIPVMIGLRDYTENKSDLMNAITEQFDICGFPNAQGFIDRAFEFGKILLLLDGLDEVKDGLVDKAVREIEIISDRYPKCLFIVTCRKGAYQNWLPRFENVELQPFVDEQREAFVRRWFDDEKHWRRCWKQIQDNSRLEELSSTPLLLTLICIAYDEIGSLPPSRTEIYREAIEALLKKWDSSRRIERSPGPNPLSIRNKELLFALIAIKAFFRDEVEFSKRFVTSAIDEFTKNMIDDTGRPPAIDGAQLLETLESHHGIVVSKTKTVYSFAHITFQEYFCAKYVSEAGDVNYVVQNYLSKPKWREVMLMIGEMQHAADDYIVMIVGQIDFLSKSAGLHSLLEGIRSISNKYPTLNPLFVRLLIIWYAFETGLLEDVRRSPFAKEVYAPTLRRTMLALNISLLSDELTATHEASVETIAVFADKHLKAQQAIAILSTTPWSDGSLSVIRGYIANVDISDYIEATLRLAECLSSDIYVRRETRSRALQSIYSH